MKTVILSSINFRVAKKTFLTSFVLLVCNLIIHAQAVYVDSNIGNDNNKGSKDAPVFSIHKAAEIIRSPGNDISVMKINPGIYILDSLVSVSTGKEMTDKRILIEAGILPDDPSWTPEKMPVVTSRAKKGELPDNKHFVVSFFIDESHVTIRGIKFPGYFYPNTRYFPIARFNKEKSDLLVEQCMFVGDEQASHIQVGIIVHGDFVKVNRCIFHNVRNAVVFWEDSGSGFKSGNTFTNCIVNGVAESAIWTCSPDKNFVFENNIVTKSKCVWVINTGNPTAYSMSNSVIVNNQIMKGNWKGKVDDFTLEEKKIVKEGEIHLRLLDGIDKDLPIDYLHIIPATLGADIGAGLFKNRKL